MAVADHYYFTDMDELNAALLKGYIFQGIACYVFPDPPSPTTLCSNRTKASNPRLQAKRP